MMLMIPDPQQARSSTVWGICDFAIPRAVIRDGRAEPGARVGQSLRQAVSYSGLGVW